MVHSKKQKQKRIVDGNIQNPNKYLLNSSIFFFSSVLIVQCLCAYTHGLQPSADSIWS